MQMLTSQNVNGYIHNTVHQLGKEVTVNGLPR